jgi:hypothetical protein
MDKHNLSTTKPLQFEDFSDKLIKLRYRVNEPNRFRGKSSHNKIVIDEHTLVLTVFFVV